MIGKGLKRKLSDDDLLETAVMQKGTGLYLDQRQSVLNISLDKFHRGQMMAEPSLRRSVLIANTLRQIQDEIRQENSVGVLAENLEPSNNREEDFSLSSAISSILKELDVVLDGSSSPLDTLVFKSDRSGNYADGYKLCDSVFGNFEVLSSSYLNDVPLDDLFLDIDTSVYERESGSLGSVLNLNELEHIMEILVGS
uniref:SERTA domain-containing protein 2-like n=1 Tax=Erpetoichthys calabaricus TaxID=27687 RepID=A0A8C4RDT2_ERPCA